MLIHLKKSHRLIAIAAAGLVFVTLIAWNHEPVYQAGDTTYYQDTVPARTSKTPDVRDLDKELDKLDRAIERLENLKTQDWDQISEKIQEQLSKINFEEIQKQAELAMKSVDLNKINLEAQKALKGIDVEVMQKQMNEALAEVKIDNEVIQKAISEVHIDTDVLQKAMAEVKVDFDKELAEIKDLDTQEMHKAMDEVKAELKKLKEELKTENPDLKKEMDKAKKEIGEAKKEIRGYQDMIYAMEKEGLLDTRKDYKIVYRDNVIYLNDKKQTEAVTAKYRKYFKENITIRKENGRFTIDTNATKED
jgi:ribosomal protein L29